MTSDYIPYCPRCTGSNLRELISWDQVPILDFKSRPIWRCADCAGVVFNRDGEIDLRRKPSAADLVAVVNRLETKIVAIEADIKRLQKEIKDLDDRTRGMIRFGER